VLGLLAGLLAGLLGLGGGIIIVPVLAELFRSQSFPHESIMIMAVATSLATIIPTSISAIWRHHQLGSIIWHQVWRLVPGILVGAALGAFGASFIGDEMLRRLFIIYLIYVGLTMLRSRPIMLSKHIIYRQLDYIIGVGIGGLSSILGIGGGTLTVPYLVNQQLTMKNAVAISSVCGLPIALSGTLTYAILGWKNELALNDNLGYIYLPAWLAIVVCSTLTAQAGARWANRMPTQKLKQIFSVVVFLIAFKMMMS